MLTLEQQRTVFHAPLVPLRFLVCPERRDSKPEGMESFSESACFHRMYNLLWTLNDSEAMALLSEEERGAAADCSRAIESLPWRIIETHPHISELPGDDLSPLLPAGKRLLKMLEARAEGTSPFGRLRRFFGLFRVPH